jgi:hypothetical protein
VFAVFKDFWRKGAKILYGGYSIRLEKSRPKMELFLIRKEKNLCGLQNLLAICWVFLVWDNFKLIFLTVFSLKKLW